MKFREIPFYIVDVFGQQRYSGNQLAVFTDCSQIEEQEMQMIAKEINFSETTFITKVKKDEAEIAVRIFTPGTELPFAGHPTLGTAHIANKVLFENSLSEITLNVRAGQIPVRLYGEVSWMKQMQPEFAIQLDKKDVAEILGLELNDIDSGFPVEWVSTGIPFYIVPLNSLQALKKAKINTDALLKHLGKYSSNEFLVFSKESYNSTDLLSVRVFVPEYGIIEDPATGSANGCLAAYLVKHKFFGEEIIDLSVAQGYEIDRPSRLFIKAKIEEKLYDIRVGGKVLFIAQGKWS